MRRNHPTWCLFDVFFWLQIDELLSYGINVTVYNVQVSRNLSFLPSYRHFVSNFQSIVQHLSTS
jgi:hypothetical protein